MSAKVAGISRMAVKYDMAFALQSVFRPSDNRAPMSGRYCPRDSGANVSRAAWSSRLHVDLG